MKSLAALVCVVNVAAFCGAFLQFGQAIKFGTNPSIWLLATVVLLVTMVWVTCYAMRLPAVDGGHSAS